ncbi:Mlo-related protein [Dillenia turbinata]|uniref:MLO-like protein n=1 Tax=Dillenia turbinata TaxID=194707 RepID=A0AAN8UV14_9MAGN
MLLGLISLMLAQWGKWISEICVDSSLFSSKLYLCSEDEFDKNKHVVSMNFMLFSNDTGIIPPKGITASTSDQCGDGREPFVSYKGLQQLHRFLFVLGMTHVLYSCVAVGLAMTKIYSWRKWEVQASQAADGNLQATRTKVMRRQSTFVFHHTSHPWSRSRVLIWMLCFLRQFKSSIKKSDYLALRLGFITDPIPLKPNIKESEEEDLTCPNHKLPHSYNFHRYMVRSMEDEFHGIVGISWPLWGYAILCIFINIHGLNIYFWLSFIPAILVMLVGTKLQHVVSSLALEIVEPTGPVIGNQVKPRDDLFWFGKPEMLLRLIQFVSFQNAFEMATFIWSLWGFQQRSCFMNNHLMIIIRLTSGLLVQFWCSYSTVPLSVIITQMGSRCKKAVIAESVRESLHSWCKRVKEKSKLSHTTRSVCSLESTIDERDETLTVASGTLSRCSSAGTLNHINAASDEHPETNFDDSNTPQFEYSFRVTEYLSNITDGSLHPPTDEDENAFDGEGEKVETLLDLFKKT